MFVARGGLGGCVVALAAVVLTAGSARAQRLPLHRYTIADGLASDRLDRATHDAQGALWFATHDGISRFDGHRFESFFVADGLPSSNTFDILAGRDGTIWVATEGGLAWLDPHERATRPHFHADPSLGTTFALRQDPSGAIWVGTATGLMRIERGAMTAIPLGDGRQPRIYSIALDAADRSLWLGASWGLVHRTAAGRVERFRVAPGDESDDRVFSVLVDHMRRLWIGHTSNKLLAIPLPFAVPTAPSLWEQSAGEPAWLRHVPEGGVRRKLLEDSRGTVWIGTRDVVRYDGRRFETLSDELFGLDDEYAPLIEDDAGNLWFGGDTQGLFRVAPAGLVSYDRRDGLENAAVFGYVSEGDILYALSWCDGHAIARRDGERFVSVRPRMPPGVTLLGWGHAQTALIDRGGRWWFPTGQGVARYPRVDRLEDLANTLPEMITMRDGLPGRDILRMYQDRRGDVWIATMSQTGLARWDHASGQIVATDASWPRGACAFAEAPTGELWIAYEDGHLVRVGDGAPRVFGDMPAPPENDSCALLFDRAGRLWLASEHGLARIDHPESPRLEFRIYTTQSGLASDRVLSLVEDDRGRIYAGTTRGLDRLDPDTGAVAHFGREDGLPSPHVHVAFRAADGTLWFGTKGGGARMLPDVVRPGIRPTYLSRLAVAGRAIPLLAGGERALPAFELASDQNQVELAFSSPSFAVGELLRFQYWLDGANSTWSPPSPDRTVRFASLAPGDYRFAVRAVRIDGSVSPEASVAFRIQAPLWQRGWFIALSALALGAIGYQLYRWRLGHALAIERVRHRIARDLHDDLGSSLSRISIMSEVASRRAASREEVAAEVGNIGRSARELVDVASDIVWSTDPRRDDLGSVIARLRSFASDVLEGRGMSWRLTAPTEPHRIKLAPDRRRQLYMIVKEAIHNAARHSGATDVTIAIVCDDGCLAATVRDNGGGMGRPERDPGNGLANMRARAQQAGGTLRIDSSEAGTEIVLSLPLRS